MIFTVPLSRQVKGTLLTVIGVLVISPDTLFIRLVDKLPNFTVQFLKFSLITLTLFIPFVIYHNSNTYIKFVNIGKSGFLAGESHTVMLLSILSSTLLCYV